MRTTTKQPTSRSGASGSPYGRDLSRHPLLGRDEQQAMAAAYWKSRDPGLCQRLVAANLRLVLKIAGDYRWDENKFPDMIQEGNIGLLLAVQHFDPRHGVSLASYAAYWIRARVLKFLLDDARLVKVPSTRGQRADFFKGRIAWREVSLDEPLASAEDATLGDTLAAPEDGRPDEVTERGEMLGRLRSELAAVEATLGPREKLLLGGRLLQDEPMTLRQVGRRLSISRERARQLESRLIGQLRRRFEGVAIAA